MQIVLSKLVITISVSVCVFSVLKLVDFNYLNYQTVLQKYDQSEHSVSSFVESALLKSNHIIKKTVVG